MSCIHDWHIVYNIVHVFNEERVEEEEEEEEEGYGLW